MPTIRAELSETNKYWISKHRHYELKHFCLQYPAWKKKYESLNEVKITSVLNRMPSTNTPTDITAVYAIKKAQCNEKIKLIERAAMNTDEFLYPYLLKSVTEGLSYTYLKTTLNIPCSRDTYYDMYRRFFWILNDLRN